MFNLFRYVAWKHLAERPLQTFMSTGGIALGVSLFTATEMLNSSVLEAIRVSLDSVAGKAALTITAGKAGFSDEKLTLARTISGVNSAIPMVETEAFLTVEGNSERAMVFGVDFRQDPVVRAYKLMDPRLTDAPLLLLNQPDGVLITHEFAASHQLARDSSFFLRTADGFKRVMVRGILRTEGPAKAYGGRAVFIDLEVAQRIFGKLGRLDRIDIIPSPFWNVDVLIDKVKDALGPGYTVEKPEVQSGKIERMVKPYQWMLAGLSILALLASFLLVSNSFSLSLAERKNEIKLLRVIGIPRLGITLLFLFESVLSGMIGGIVGVVLGWIFALSLMKWLSLRLSDHFPVLIEISNISFGSELVLRSLLLSFIVSFLAVIWPALQAGRLALKGSKDLGDENRNVKRPAPWGGFLTQLAQDNLLRKPRRSAFRLVSLVFGLSFTVAVMVVHGSFRGTVVRGFENFFKFDLVVTSQGQVITRQTQPLHEKLSSEFNQTPGVKRGGDGAYGLRMVPLQFAGAQILLKAYDEPDPDLHYSIFDVLDRNAEDAGYDLYHNPEPTVLMSQSFSNKFGKKTGDRIEIESPSGMVQFRIAGIVADFSSKSGTLYLNRALYKSYWKDPLVDAFGVLIAPGFDLETVQMDLDARFGRLGLVVSSQNELRQRTLDMMDQSFQGIKTAALATLGMGFFAWVYTLLVAFMESQRELGLLRALGMTQSQVFSMMLQEALLQGGVGVLTAVVLGGAMGYFWISTRLPEELSWAVQFYFPWAAVGVTIMTGIALSFLAVLLPARKAGRMEIGKALGY